MKFIFQVFVALALTTFCVECTKLLVKKESTSIQLDKDTIEEIEDESGKEKISELEPSIYHIQLIGYRIISPYFTTKNCIWLITKSLGNTTDTYQSLPLAPPENC
jgi:hypothetical protein